MAGFGAHHMGVDPAKPHVGRMVEAVASPTRMKKPRIITHAPRPPEIDRLRKLSSDASTFRAIRGVPTP